VWFEVAELNRFFAEARGMATVLQNLAYLGI
jgi:hypothetical protein